MQKGDLLDRVNMFLGRSYHARVGYLGLPDTITVIDLDCTEAFVKGKGKLWCSGKLFFLTQ